MSCARVKQYQSSDIGSAERHNERKNGSYDNINVEINDDELEAFKEVLLEEEY